MYTHETPSTHETPASDPSTHTRHAAWARSLSRCWQLRDGFDSHPGEQLCCSSLVLCVFICLSSSLCLSLSLRISVIDSHFVSVGLSCDTASPHNHTRGSLFVSVYLAACLCVWACVCCACAFLCALLPAESTAEVNFFLGICVFVAKSPPSLG